MFHIITFVPFDYSTISYNVTVPSDTGSIDRRHSGARHPGCGKPDFKFPASQVLSSGTGRHATTHTEASLKREILPVHRFFQICHIVFCIRVVLHKEPMGKPASIQQSSHSVSDIGLYARQGRPSANSRDSGPPFGGRPQSPVGGGAAWLKMESSSQMMGDLIGRYLHMSYWRATLVVVQKYPY